MAEIFLIEVAYRTCVNKRDDYFPERDTSDMTRAETIKDIRHGQYENVNRVIAVDLDNGTARDATREIARQILDEIDEPPLPFLQSFLENALGCGAVARLLNEMKAA